MVAEAKSKSKRRGGGKDAELGCERICCWLGNQCGKRDGSVAHHTLHSIGVGDLMEGPQARDELCERKKPKKKSTEMRTDRNLACVSGRQSHTRWLA